MEIRVKRIYESVSGDDGYRVLVDRLWPRGVSKERASLDEWVKDLAPSDELRRWFHTDLSRFDEFRGRYLAELNEKRDQIEQLLDNVDPDVMTLLFASRETERNHAHVLRDVLLQHAKED